MTTKGNPTSEGERPYEAMLAALRRESRSPMFVISEPALARNLSRLRDIAEISGVSLLYSVKALSIMPVLELVAPTVDGFSCSSSFETLLAREVGRESRSIHGVVVGASEPSLLDMAKHCDYLTLNSLEQLERYEHEAGPAVSAGLRINPEISFVSDPRIDPCSLGSRLGVPLAQLSVATATEILGSGLLEGVHVHSNCESENVSELCETIDRVASHLGKALRGFKWWNLGGGYVLGEIREAEVLRQSLRPLREEIGLSFFIEPGAAVVRDACFLVARVVDVLRRREANIAVLDTTVHHWPEVFEYGFSPVALASVSKGEFLYTLTGASCLAGDVFGSYRFSVPLEVGDSVVFLDAGPYSLAKASHFNGLRMPSVYVLRRSGALEFQYELDYSDYRRLQGGQFPCR